MEKVKQAKEQTKKPTLEEIENIIGKLNRIVEIAIKQVADNYPAEQKRPILSGIMKTEKEVIDLIKGDG